MINAAELLALVDLTRLERPDDAPALDALVPKTVTPAGRVAAGAPHGSGH